MSVDTERTHMMNILNKLAVHSRLQASSSPPATAS
jgi:DNA-binding CsgD family transcriptional regulator